jgi:hypothetical protein
MDVLNQPFHCTPLLLKQVPKVTCAPLRMTLYGHMLTLMFFPSPTPNLL